MAVLQPATERMLGIMLREIEQTIAPELTSTHAKTVAHLVGQGLRNLLIREQVIPILLETLTSIQAELIIQSGNALPQQSLSAASSALALGRTLESIVAGRMELSQGGRLDDICRRAVAAEGDYLERQAQSIENVVVPQRSADRELLFAITPERLTDYFRRRLPKYKTIRVTAVRPVLSGFSKDTVLVDIEADAESLSLVIRRNMTYAAVDTTVIDEYPIVSSLHKYGLAVPEPVLLETDTGEFGEAFSVTRRAAGRAATNSMAGIVAGPELMDAAYELAAFLARLHQIDLRDLGLPREFYDENLSARDYLLREIAVCERYYRQHASQPSPTIAAALAWLRANIPELDAAPCLVHGDASLANIMMDDRKMTVMLDWELAHPGDFVEDIAYSRTWIDQIMPWSDFLAHYYQHGGQQYRPERERFYTMLSDLRVAMFDVRALDMLAKCDHPEVGLMYAAPHYYGFFVGRLGRNLAAL